MLPAGRFENKDYFESSEHEPGKGSCSSLMKHRKNKMTAKPSRLAVGVLDDAAAAARIAKSRC
jgi:hypothetical protein